MIATEYGWLVEVEGPIYLTINRGLFAWTRDANSALRFARKVDAELMITRGVTKTDERSRADAKATEHGFDSREPEVA